MLLWEGSFRRQVPLLSSWLAGLAVVALFRVRSLAELRDAVAAAAVLPAWAASVAPPCAVLTARRLRALGAPITPGTVAARVVLDIPADQVDRYVNAFLAGLPADHVVGRDRAGDGEGVRRIHVRCHDMPLSRGFRLSVERGHASSASLAVIQIARDNIKRPVLLPDCARTQVAVNRMLKRVAAE